MSRVAVYGGPADGSTVRRAGGQRWIPAEGGRGFTRTAPGRSLYILTGGRYVYAGESARICVGCGVLWIPQPDSADPPSKCRLCGGDLQRAHQQ